MTVSTNNITDALGTGSPDFPQGMPTVAGDPIVESGSNSDGEWTKFADGTQVCSKSFTVTTAVDGGPTTGYYWAGTGLPNETLPMSFIDTSYSVNFSARAPSSVTPVAANDKSAGSVAGFICSPSSITSREYAVSMSAIGRWK